MAGTKEEILVVDDSLAIRTTMSLVLSELGYRVRTAEDGLTALREVHRTVPDILLSDLDMPIMSGFELLSISRRSYPEIQIIAMSGAYSPYEVNPVVAADAFFHKGQGVEDLLRTLATLTQTPRRAPLNLCTIPPIIIHRNAHESTPGAGVTISCPECLKAFAAQARSAISRLFETRCPHCDSPIQYAIVQHSNENTLQTSQFKPGATLRTQNAPSFCY